MYKSKLQELCHKHSWNLPVYSTQRNGPDHCPVFTTTLTVNNLEFSSPKDGSKSSKEAQNAAAKIAFDYLSSLPANHHHPHQLLKPAPSVPPSPSVPSAPIPLAASSTPQSHGGNVDVLLPSNDLALSNKHIFEPVKNDVLQEDHGVKIQGGTSKDLLHVYKNQLQHYTQKNNISLPAYTNEFVGLPHARHFKANVMVDGNTYQSPDYYSTLKDAEHAAAKVALEALSVAEIPENEGLSKSILQELAQKRGLRFPSYSTVKSGPLHNPTFVSTVEVGGITYEGVGCKTKKQAETSAAKVAYEKLCSGNAGSQCSPKFTLSKSHEGSCRRLQPANINDCQPTDAKITQKNLIKRAPGEMNAHSEMLSFGSDGKELSSPPLGSNSLLNIPAKLAPMVKDANLNEEVGGDGKAKRHRRSSPSNISHHLPEAFPPSSDFSIDPSSCSVPSESVKSEEAGSTNGDQPQDKVLIFRRGSSMEIPDGAVILPHQDDEWVAMKVPLHHDQKV